MPHPSGARAEDAEDKCPVCKTSRYLNPKMKFKINPECYHRMCESCVERIFSQGPAPCPVAGCGRTLRKNKFKQQTFADIKIERECDIRRRVEDVFNRREDDFVSIRAYNDYLEMKEDITFNLIEKTDVAATEAKIAAYAAQNTSSIAKNAALASQEHTSLQRREAAKIELARLDKQAARQAEEDERREKENARRDVVNKIAEGRGDPEAIVREGQKVVLKKSTVRRTAAELGRREQQMNELLKAQKGEVSVNDSSGNGAAAGGFVIQGLKPAEVVEPEKEYDPFDGLNIERNYYVLAGAYEHEWLDNARNDPLITAGGYDVSEYCTRSLLEAFAGLGCFIAVEKAEIGGPGATSGSAGLADAAVTVDAAMDDPF